MENRRTKKKNQRNRKKLERLVKNAYVGRNKIKEKVGLLNITDKLTPVSTELGGKEEYLKNILE